MVDDLVLLDTLSEGKITETLQNRYAVDQIYTNIASVLIAINPFKMIASNYTDAKIREYKGKKHYELNPHVFALADEAYSNMISYRENQCVIISGESGSGKTETSKFIMQYISGVSGKSAEVIKVKERMLSSNPILEGFGNAKTVNNNNSSRFGKYMEILFDYGGDPVGGRVTNYLLEKSRVVGPGSGERNFHVFYQVCSGATAAERQAYCLENADYYYYLSVSGCYQVPGINDAEDWREMTESMRTVGINEAERQEVIRSIAVCLWLGNVAFEERKPEVAEVRDRAVLDIVAGLLQVQPAALEAALCNRQIQTGVGARAEKYVKPNTAAASDFSRDTLAKAIFTRLFDYLVAKINISIQKDNFQGIQIGVLDIYGFEIFQFNSFEQLCINFVNEKLQQIFIELTLKAEQEEYAAEGIPWRDIPFQNNKPLCDLIENKPGLLSICDDCCNTAKTDLMFVNDLKSYFSGNVNIQCGQADFSVRHYAGDVRYVSDNFLTKNKDTLFDDLIVVMQSSPAQFVRDHGWAAIEVTEGQKKKPPTVGAIFRSQVGALMTALKACQPHYIRCIKPNHTKKPNEFDRENVARQVKYLGLLENVRVRRAGYAHRSTFERFLKRYGMLSKTIWSGKGRGSARDFCAQLVGDLGWTANKEYAMGKSKIFIQDATTLFALEDALDRRMDEAIATIQKAWRSFKNKLYFTRVRSEAYALVNGRKERRRGSVSARYQGDYIHAASNKLLHGLLSMSGGSREKILFADRVRHELLKGKRSVLGSVFGKKQTLLDEPRLVLLTDKALYSCAIGFDEASARGKVDLFFRVPILHISHVVASPYCDNWVVIHFAQGAAPGAGGAGMPTDVLWRVRHKTELFALLAQESKKQGRGMFDLRFQPSDTVVANAAKKRTVEVTWVKDEMLDSCTDRLERVAHNVAIRVGSGMAPNQVPVPPKPSEADASLPGGGGRPCVKAMFDCAGNTAQGELAFKTGEILFIVKDEEGGWFECTNAGGQRGFVPGTYVERVKKAAAAASRPGASSSGPKTTPKPLFNFTASSSGVPPPISVAAKKSPWEELKSDAGETYYYNSATQQSQWDKPAEMNAPPVPTASSGVMSPVSSSISQGCAFGGCGKPRFGGKPYCAQHAMGGGGASNNPPPVSSAASGPPAVPGRFGAGAGAASTPAPAARPAFGGGASSTPVPAPRPVIGGGATPAPAPAARPVARFGGGASSATPSNTAPGPARPAINTGAVAANRANLFANGAVPIFGAPRPMGTGNPNAAGMYSAPAAAAAPAPMAARPPAFAAPAPAKKKSDWVAVLDESSGNTYYFNEKTNESSWDKPADL